MMSNMSPTGVTVRRTCSPPESSSSGGQRTRAVGGGAKMEKSEGRGHFSFRSGRCAGKDGLKGPVVSTVGDVAADLGGAVWEDRSWDRGCEYLGQGCRKRHSLSRSRCQPARWPALWQSSFQGAAGPGGHPQTWHIEGGTHTALWPPEGNTEQLAGKRTGAQIGAGSGRFWGAYLSQAAVLDFILEDKSIGVRWLKPAQKDTALAGCLPGHLPWDTISLSCGRGHKAATTSTIVCHTWRFCQQRTARMMVLP